MLWKQVLKGNKIRQNESLLFKQFEEIEVFDKLENSANLPCSETDNNKSIQEVDLGVINYWAFKNLIPMTGHFELTGRCNLRCKHCYCTFKNKDTLNTNEIFKIIDDLYVSGTFGLVLTGGEIFIREDIVDILDYLNEKKFILRLNTNGTFVDEEIVKKMEKFSNIYRIHISLYGSKPEVHDKITQINGSFQKTIKAINLLKEAGFDIRINCSLMQSNANSYKEIKFEIGDKLNIPLHYDPFIFPKDNGKIENMYEMFDDDQFIEYEKFARKQPTVNKPKLCKAAFSFFSICEDGSVYPCLKMKRYYTKPLGNLTETSFNEIWNNSEEINNVRTILNNKLRDCKICDVSV